ncbi:DMT family transporter [Pseudalkalibacillus caeni]|uniref:Multidrug efflux SMR transporter n=1 Tax=Exobacillus caeni TaxID=2574798 RepID=A0A5R9F108_9BACL|nr:multidrug efflux SMR transporter [Pseudalkalibacillus caeni]TLS37247.1 multidrug efflux SMR transporter [Pseudalkalibacillus caeni]
MAWIVLVFAGFAEVGGVISLKMAEGFKKIKPMFSAFLFGCASFYMLSIAMKTLPVGSAYAVWTGIGTAGSVLVGMAFFNENRDIKRIVLISCIVIAAVGLKITG